MFKKSAFFVLFLVVCGLASTVVEDSRSRFVVDDDVYESSVHRCENGDGARFFPENAVVSEEDGGVYRVYRVALPSNAKPSVRLGKVKLLPLGAPYCKEASLKFRPLTVGNPYLRDGLWIVEIVVPLLEKRGNSVSLRKSFELTVEFAGGAPSGVYPGKRAVDRVLNRKSAARFGVDQGKSRKALRRSAQSELDNVEFLAMFMVGDREVASFTEDGFYAVEFKTIRNALMALNRQEELDAIRIDKICLYGGNPDTLTERVPGTSLLTPNQIFEIPIEIRDHSKDSPAPDGYFGPGDSLLFVGYGTSIWKRMDRENRESLRCLLRLGVAVLSSSCVMSVAKKMRCCATPITARILNGTKKRVRNGSGIGTAGLIRQRFLIWNKVSPRQRTCLALLMVAKIM